MKKSERSFYTTARGDVLDLAHVVRWVEVREGRRVKKSEIFTLALEKMVKEIEKEGLVERPGSVSEALLVLEEAGVPLGTRNLGLKERCEREETMEEVREGRERIERGKEKRRVRAEEVLEEMLRGKKKRGVKGNGTE